MQQALDEPEGTEPLNAVLRDQCEVAAWSRTDPPRTAVQCHGLVVKKSQRHPAVMAQAVTLLDTSRVAEIRMGPVLDYAVRLYRDQNKSAEAQKLEERAASIRDKHKKALNP